MIYPQPKPPPRPRKPRNPLARSRMRKRLPRRIGKPGDLPEYRDFVRSLTCLAIGMKNAGPCSSLMEAHHAGPKSDDTTCIPLCSDHHKFRGWHSSQGPFRAWGKERRRIWAAARIIETRVGYFTTTGVNVLPPVAA